MAFFGLGRRSGPEKDVDILILHHQLNIVACNKQAPIKPSRTEKLIPAVMVNNLKQHSYRSALQLREILRIFQPETGLRWHCELVRRKWTLARWRKSGRPRLNPEFEIECLFGKGETMVGRWQTDMRAPQVVMP